MFTVEMISESVDHLSWFGTRHAPEIGNDNAYALLEEDLGGNRMYSARGKKPSSKGGFERMTSDLRSMLDRVERARENIEWMDVCDL
jgi:hypothetical protein